MLKFLGVNGGLGSLGDAFVWISAMDLLHEDVRPAGWGKIIIDNCKQILGLKPTERFTIKEAE